jgi:uncharacterized membrane protein YcaP (DUF421 family)
MEAEDIHITDLKRILVGEVPAEFYIELLIRVLVVYIVALIAIRVMGKRMAGQLSKNELAALVSIAAAVGVSVQAPDRGLFAAMVVVSVIVIVSKLMAIIASKNKKFERLSQGTATVFVENATLQLKNMKKVRVSTERVFSQLRSEQIKHLGEVKRLYMEANGKFSLLKEEQPKPGLSILPDWDEDFKNEQKKQSQSVCKTCGHLSEQIETEKSCPNCNEKNWTNAVKNQ